MEKINVATHHHHPSFYQKRILDKILHCKTKILCYRPIILTKGIIANLYMQLSSHSYYLPLSYKIELSIAARKL